MTIRRKLIEGAAAFGIDLTDEKVDACLVYLVELKKWNRKINLTAIRDEKEIISKHFVDSFSFLKGFTPAKGLVLLDIGSGAGFPALPIRIAAPMLSVVLVESVKKKCVFLRHVVRTLQLENVVVLDMRTEELGEEHKGKYDIVTARAFAPMETAIAAGAPLLNKGGLLVLSRGPDEKVSEASVAAQKMTIQSRQEIHLPGSGDPRALWVFRKA